MVSLFRCVHGACRDARLVRPHILRRYFVHFLLIRGHEYANKGNSEKPFVYWGLAHALRARVGEDLKCLYARCDVCVCVCVKTFSEICKYKALKDARESEFFCMPLLLLVIFACLIISLIVQTPIPLT